MSADQPEIQMVEVPRHRVTLTMDDILRPLAQTQARLAVANADATANSEVSDQLSRFTALVNELREVAASLDQADPTLLQSKPGPPPEG